MQIKEKLKELEIELSVPSKALANYLAAKKIGDQVWVSGQLPLVDGKLESQGCLYQEEEELGYKQARQCFLNALSVASSIVELEAIVGVDKITGYVSSSDSFFSQHLVVNGASDVAVEIFGDQGRHVRAAVGVNVLPINASVEVEVVFSISEN